MNEGPTVEPTDEKDGADRTREKSAAKRAVKPPKSARKKALKRKSGGAVSTSLTSAIEERIGYHFCDPQWLLTALTHVSALKVPTDRSGSYQRLEFLGDRVLGLIVSDMLFQTFPKADEGELSKRLADLVRRETCVHVASGFGLDAAIQLGAVGGSGERLRMSVLGDICEAVIGAIYVDGGYPAASEFVRRAWSELLHKPMRALRDPKTVLQEWAQGRGYSTPTYREIERSGPHHDPRFKVEVRVRGLKPTEGAGGSKRAAEKAAALAFLEREGVTSSTDG